MVRGRSSAVLLAAAITVAGVLVGHDPVFTPGGQRLFAGDAEVAGALAAPQLLPLSYLVDTDGSVRRPPMLVFRDVAAVTETVAAARGERQRS